MSSKEKRVILADTAGFCWGVKRAMDITMDIAKNAGRPVYTHGPLIHNPQVIETLEGSDVYAVVDADRLDPGATIIIRTHGVAPDVRRSLKDRGLAVADATCPLVAKAQGIIRKYARKGYTTVIIGDTGHAEVVGLTGYAEGRCHVINAVADVALLPAMDDVAVVAQTTCDTTRYRAIVDALRARFPALVENNTICDATEERQGEVIRLAREVEALVVVGGANSANTKRLAAIAEAAGAATFLIETEDDLDGDAIDRFDRVGVTAGASTPAWMIERVVAKIETIQRSAGASNPVRDLARGAVTSNAALAVGAAGMATLNAVMGRYPPSIAASYVAAAYIFTMYVLNQLNDVTTFKHNEPEKIRYYLEHRRLLTVAAWSAAGTALGVAAATAPAAAAVLLLAMGVGLGYSVKWFPKIDWLRIHRLKDIPASKDLFVAFAWLTMTAVTPALMAAAPAITPAMTVAALFTFGLVYIRTVLSDIRDVEGDRMVGRETIPILIGVEATYNFLWGLTGGLALLLGLSYGAGWIDGIAFFAMAPIAYTALYLALYQRRVISRGVRFDLLVDGVFLVAGAAAGAWLLFV
jgi:4-hydroxy-3-methylbut-2-enyl diphosphate reductase